MNRIVLGSWLAFTAALTVSGCGNNKPVVAPPTAAAVETQPDAAVEAAATTNSAARPPKVTSFSLDGNSVELPGPIVFETGTATINEAESAATLWLLIDYLEAKSYISTLRIEGHMSEAGAAAQTLTEARALAVAAWLIANGVACDRLLAVGFGNTKPIADNKTPDGRAQNNRITVVNAALRGHAIGGMPLDGGGNSSGAVCK